jgi:hypothetical protein
LRVEDVTPSEHMEYYLAGQHWLDAMTPPLEEHLRRLADAVLTLVKMGDGAALEGEAAEAQEETAKAPPPEPPAAAGGRRSRRRLVIVAAIVALCVVAAVVGIVLLRDDGPDPSGQSTAVAVTVERIDADEGWTVAFAGPLPDQAHQIEGWDGSPAKAYDTLISCGAVDYGETPLRVSVRGLSSDTVVVRDIRAETEKTTAYSGTSVFCSSAGANAATVLVIDLESENPVAWEGAEGADGLEPTGSAPWFDRNNVTLAKGEVHDFIVAGLAKSSLVHWRIVLDLDVAGDKQMLTVDDSGQPFVTSGQPASGFDSTMEWAWWKGGDPIVPYTAP